MDNIVEMTTIGALYLSEAVSRAVAEGKTFRITTGKNRHGEQWVKFKVGEGMWSAPYYGVPQIPSTPVGDFVMTVE